MKEILRERETLRKFFRYIPDSKTWTLDIKRFDHTDGQVKELSSYLSSLFKVSVDEINYALNEEIKRQRENLEDEKRRKLSQFLREGKFAVIPTEFLDEKRREIARMFFTFKGGYYYLDERKLTNYIIDSGVVSETSVLKMIKSVMDECKLKYYPEHIEWLKQNIGRIHDNAKKLFEEMGTIVINDTGEDIEVIIKKTLSSEEIQKLMSAFTTVYYTSDQHRNLTEHRMRVIRYDRTRRAYRIPYFGVPHLISVAKELGFRKLRDNVEWVRRRIPQPEKFDIKLYNFQKEALVAWLKNNCRGTVVIPTGGGKTFVGLSALYYLHVPTLVCVTTIELARQWRQALKEKLGIHAGLLGGGVHEIDDVTVAIYNSAVNHIEEIKDKFDLVIFDECLTYDTLVLTDRGWIPIGEIVEKRLPVKVLTHTGRFMPVVGWHKVPLRKRLVKVVLDDGTVVKCTEDHKFLTERGWVEAIKLSGEDVLYRVLEKGCNATVFESVRVASRTLCNPEDEIQDYVYDLTVAEDHSYVASGVVVHNCHHVPADTFRKVAFRTKARRRLGLSATPYRNDRNEALIFFSVGDVVYKAKYEDMVKLKLASPLKYYRFYVNLTPSEEEKYASESGNTKPNRIQNLLKIAYSAKEKYDILKKIISRLPRDKIIVFCQYVKQAEKAYKAVREVAKGQVALLTGETNAKLRDKYFEEFKSGQKRIIVTTTVLDEGINVPDAETAIILSGSGTERQMVQRIGRVIRYQPGKVAKIIEIITKNTVEEKIASRRCKVLEEYGIKLS